MARSAFIWAAIVFVFYLATLWLSSSSLPTSEIIGRALIVGPIFALGGAIFGILKYLYVRYGLGRR